MMIKRFAAVFIAVVFTMVASPSKTYASTSGEASVYEKVTYLGYIYKDKIAEAIRLAVIEASAVNVEDMLLDNTKDLIFAMNQKAKLLEPAYELTMSSKYDFEETISRFNSLYFEGIEAVSYSYRKSSRAEYTVKLEVRYFDYYSVLRAYKNPKLAWRLTADEAVLLDKARGIVSELISSGMTEYERVLAVHDYLVLNGSYDTSEVDSIREESFDAYGILVDGVGVCDSYSKSMALLLNMAGVECIKVSGKAQNPGQSTVIGHSWNKVKIHGRWYNVDVTWDDPVPDKKGLVSYEYFNVTDEMLAKDHTWNTDIYPKANDNTYNYFVYNKLVARTYSQFMQKLSEGMENLIQTGGRQVDIYVTDYDHTKYDLSFLSKYGIKAVRYKRPEDKEGVFTLIVTE